MVCIRGHLVTPEFAEYNAKYHMDGFDDLPERLRDSINYSDTTEGGAPPVKDILGRRQSKRSKALAAAAALAWAAINVE